MASRDINDLIPKLRPIAKELLKRCVDRGVEMRTSQTLRDPFEQARLWRQSRSTEEIKKRIARFREQDADFLAHCLESVGKQNGDPVTNAPPGLSWHQWGEAMDCFWLVDGEAVWSPNKLINGVNGFRVYAEEAKKLELTAGAFFKSIKDFPHVQLRTQGSPTGAMTLKEINDEMKKRFGHLG